MRFLDDELYTAKDLAKALGCDARLARQILVRLGIEPVTPRRHLFFGAQIKTAMRMRQENRLEAMGGTGSPGLAVLRPAGGGSRSDSWSCQHGPSPRAVQRRRLRDAGGNR